MKNGKSTNLHPYAPAACNPQEIFLVLISVRGWVEPQGHSAAGRIMSMKNSSDTIGGRTFIQGILSYGCKKKTDGYPTTEVHEPHWSEALLSRGHEINVQEMSEICSTHFER
jgi:hypothetical protein